MLFNAWPYPSPFPPAGRLRCNPLAAGISGGVVWILASSDPAWLAGGDEKEDPPKPVVTIDDFFEVEETITHPDGTVEKNISPATRGINPETNSVFSQDEIDNLLPPLSEGTPPPDEMGPPRPREISPREGRNLETILEYIKQIESRNDSEKK